MLQFSVWDQDSPSPCTFPQYFLNKFRLNLKYAPRYASSEMILYTELGLLDNDCF